MRINNNNIITAPLWYRDTFSFQNVRKKDVFEVVIKLWKLIITSSVPAVEQTL